MAHSLAKFSHSLIVPQVFFDIQSIPRDPKAYYYLDKVAMIAFIRKKMKRIKEPP